MINLCSGVVGMQFAWALLIANISSIYLFYHANESSLGWLWIALPVTGIVVQPIVGHQQGEWFSEFHQQP